MQPPTYLILDTSHGMANYPEPRIAENAPPTASTISFHLVLVLILLTLSLFYSFAPHRDESAPESEFKSELKSSSRIREVEGKKFITIKIKYISRQTNYFLTSRIGNISCLVFKRII